MQWPQEHARNVEAGSTRAGAVDADGRYFLYKDYKIAHDSLPSRSV